MKIACPKGLQPALGQAIITGENREKPIDNICPPKRLWLKNKKKIFLSEREKVGGEKGVCGGVWECGKPVRFSIISMPRSEGEKGVCGGVWECGKPVRFSIISMPRSEGEKGR